MENTGVQSIGIKTPIIREGDDLKSIVVNSVLDSVITSYPFDPTYELDDKDVIGITESIVARAQGNYVTIDDIVQFMKEKNFSKNLVLFFPIMSRNRFSMILKAFSRYANNIKIFVNIKTDEVGNPTRGKNPFTGVDIQKYYKEIAESENCNLQFVYYDVFSKYDKENSTVINCMCHPENIEFVCNYNLKDIMNSPVVRKDGTTSGYNSTYGLLGSNKANEEKLKLFPDPIAGQQLVEDIQKEIFNITGHFVEVMIYGDGCFKDPMGGIWEFADPVVSPAYTSGLEGTPNEIKLKALADDQLRGLSGKDLEKAVKGTIKLTKNEDLKSKMSSQGTTPRRYIDLLGSLMDLTSGSGDKGTPVVLVKNYFNKYCD